MLVEPSPRCDPDELARLVRAVRGLPTLAAVHRGRHVDGQRGFAGRKPMAALFERLAALVDGGAALRP